ncbi:sensor histidine kinase [Haloterrigena alkaliphila]|uniref:histidine kinase n=1 Tax=Haloterrigena alkaliphila TaxID=2816475 RepID=A0A8A2VKP2_9EURY|nr:HAMP domain-containing sensor histidine kinase [Haloterrigena alkaliphila]QSX00965.1 HAMP domain-containing histidine kinase [Haloterrigena alkaliphila]
MNGGSDGGVGRDSLPWLVSGFGALSFAAVLFQWLWFASTLDTAAYALGFVTVGVPALSLIWGGYHLERSAVDPARYDRVVAWCFGSGAAFLAINVLVIAFFPWYGLAGNLAWAHFALNTGAGAGFVVGYVEARAIQREVEATAAAVRAEQLADERELLTYLNDLLRHEVLNSAQIIGGHASLLREEVDDPDDRLETIERESDALTDVIDDVRAMLNANQDLETAAVVDLSDLLTDELASLRRQFDDLEIETSIPEAVFVEGNEGISWIFANVLENAIEHDDGDAPRVAVTVETRLETVAVRVADDGPGIPADTRETLFEPKSTNHGLGLYLARILAKRYGGDVELTETGPDGSVFTVTLSRASADGTDEPTDRERATNGERVANGERSADGPSVETAANADSRSDSDARDETAENTETAERATGRDADPDSSDPATGSS